ncbi:hypothetical protein H0H93_000028 [Arthromyces matolae]|nr:hypothetical protein H0H93_000028 [Arthromyces matolae]
MVENPSESDTSSSTQPVANVPDARGEPTSSQLSSSVVKSTDRTELLSRARGFLHSPQIMQQDALAKRQFLVEKGLNELEIDGLLREIPPPRPSVPPRTYPQLPPSNLPNILLGLTRIFSWIAGGSATLIFIYYRFLLPRITQTSLARRSLKTHHISLLRRLNENLASIQKAQTETHSVLPSPDPSQEDLQFRNCIAVADILKIVGDKPNNIPPVTLLRCSIEHFSKVEEADASRPTTEELFSYMESQISWLVSEDGLKYEELLWQTLSTSPMFSGTALEGDRNDSFKPTRWTYNIPEPLEPSPVLASMKRLTASLPKNSHPTNNNTRQHTLQALTDFTGYISTQMYMPYQAPSSAAGFLSGNTQMNPAEEDFKREIRALKGLVLNRRSFMPTTPRHNMPLP